MQILIIGGGNMGLTYAESFVRSHIASKESMMVLEKSPEKAQQLSSKGIGTIYGRAEDCLPLADLVILAVKPQDAPTLFESIRPLMNDQQVVLSIMAGVTIDAIIEGLGSQKVIRAMPNLPAQIGMGMTVFTSSQEVTRLELVMVQNLLNTAGKTLYVEAERAIDSATAVSGSGPAYVWFFMDAMIHAARELGFSESEAAFLVAQTFRGTIELHSKSDLSCQEWISRVASKGGTTEAAIKVFQDGSVSQDIEAAMKAAFNRAVELGKK